MTYIYILGWREYEVVIVYSGWVALADRIRIWIQNKNIVVVNGKQS
jgi:hypothetical protein